ncbi:hypothetical protein [Rhodovulum sulfidophilum]|uniref:Uncharacterized protein n=1 Tax=Rhodovulum sulfidophilum TaxID=35806 RepID=A0ABS1RQR4_RHOSU|nr:hypothetical protein [Rhodovulum sulfidophilum]MBL3608232.1 hypothetical protein [Rhodovulum sulfidophilum]MCE8456487.1 hypothetical protein [Rhodovulum sulfidophilum]
MIKYSSGNNALVDSILAWFRYTLTSGGHCNLRDGYERVATGGFCEVWFSGDTLSVYQQAPPKDRARIDRIIDNLSERGPTGLNDQMFKSEGKFSNGQAGGSKTAVYALKSYQLRVYAFWGSGKKGQLICPEACIKKQNKADNKQLQRVAKESGKLKWL